MTADEVAALIIDRASRFGEHNPQQLQYLSGRLRTIEEGTVARGLLSLFTDGPAPPEGSAAQELAGRMLALLRPRTDIDLHQLLPAALGRYELSVEQFPHYLGWAFGVEQVLAELELLTHAPLSPDEERAVQTMRFWLRT